MHIKVCFGMWWNSSGWYSRKRWNRRKRSASFTKNWSSRWDRWKMRWKRQALRKPDFRKLRQRCAVILNLWISSIRHIHMYRCHWRCPVRMQTENFMYTRIKRIWETRMQSWALFYIWIWNTLALPMSQWKCSIGMSKQIFIWLTMRPMILWKSICLCWNKSWKTKVISVP